MVLTIDCPIQVVLLREFKLPVHLDIFLELVGIPRCRETSFVLHKHILGWGKIKWSRGRVQHIHFQNVHTLSTVFLSFTKSRKFSSWGRHWDLVASIIQSSLNSAFPCLLVFSELRERRMLQFFYSQSLKWKCSLKLYCTQSTQYKKYKQKTKIQSFKTMCV